MPRPATRIRCESGRIREGYAGAEFHDWQPANDFVMRRGAVSPPAECPCLAAHLTWLFAGVIPSQVSPEAVRTVILVEYVPGAAFFKVVATLPFALVVPLT